MSVLHCTALWYALFRSQRDRDGTESMPPTQSYSLRLDTDRRGRLEEIARRKDRDVAYLIRKAIDEYIERHKDDPDGG